MNIRKVLKLIGEMLKLEGVCMALPFICGIIYKERAGIHFALIGVIVFMIGIMLSSTKVKDARFFSAEGFVTVALGWVFLSFFGALPFYFSREIPNFIDALFETISGFTTTGATILSEVENMSKCMLFWRSFSHFLGGMGVLVLVLAIIPTQGENMFIMKAESPGPSVGKLLPKVADTAKILYVIYVILTLLSILLYFLSGLPLFDAICIGFGSAGTGGFTVTNDGIGHYAAHSQVLIATMTLLFGVNFNIYYLMIMKQFKSAFHSEELRTYITIIIIATITISLNTLNFYNGVYLESLEKSYFQVISILTTTGYATTNFANWPMLSKYLLLVLMVIGGSAGSTGGGFKISRIIILIKSAINQIYFELHPNSVKIVRFEDKPIDSHLLRSVTSYLLAYILIIIVSIFLISYENFDFETTFSSVIETFNNIGQGLGRLGPTGNFSIFGNFSKVIFMLLMLIGRLEIFPVLLLFSSKTWKREV